MPFIINYDRKVVKKHIPKIPATIKGQISRAINERLTIDPIGFGKPLAGDFKGLYRLRVGDWRVIYQVEGKTVAIRAIMLRRDAYKG